MKLTDETEKHLLEALHTDILTERWEREAFANALVEAERWGKKIDKENEDNKKKNRFYNKYNS